MFDTIRTVSPPEEEPRGELMSASMISSWTQTLSEIGGAPSDAERIDQIRALEELTCAAQAAQASLAADFDASQRARAAAAGVPAERRGRGIAEQIALARRESPHRGRQHLGLAKVLRDEMPHTRAAFRAGRITEWRATLLARETACLSLVDRRRVDRSLAGDLDALEAMGDRQVLGEARRLAYRLDPESFVERRRQAEAERRVTSRPAPDVMTQLSASLPVTQGVAVFAALSHHADGLISRGDPRGRGQIMADTLVQRVTGRAAADLQPVAVNLVVSNRSLLGDDRCGAYVEGYGPVPADLARDLVASAETATLRRLYVKPGSGDLVAVESRSRRFPAGLARLIRLRDRTCRTPWCDAAIRHIDHVESLDEGGATTAANGQGLCEGCNHAKQAPGWRARPGAGRRHTVTTVTATGHTYRSTAPPVLESRVTPQSRAELIFTDLVLAA